MSSKKGEGDEVNREKLEKLEKEVEGL